MNKVINYLFGVRMLYAAAIVLTYLLIQTNAELSPDSRRAKIVGGLQVTNRSEFAYQASIRYNGSHICGGTVLDWQHVVTAAQCCYDFNSHTKLKPGDLAVVVGDLNIYNSSANTVTRTVTYIFSHSYYKSSTYANDIAILRVDGTFFGEASSSSVQAIGWASNLPEPSTECISSGWGAQSTNGLMSPDLHYARISPINMTTCRNIYGLSLKSGMFCAGNFPFGDENTCQGDTGGPLVCNKLLTGIVSWGKGCGISDTSGVYTDVSQYTNWINKQLESSPGDTSLSHPLSIFVAIVLHGFIFC